MFHFINMTAFECRCIRPGGVVPHMPIKEHGIGGRGYPRGSISSESGALPHRTCKYASVATPCRMRRIDPLGATPYS